jgi:hypothetical protein
MSKSEIDERALEITRRVDDHMSRHIDAYMARHLEAHITRHIEAYLAGQVLKPGFTAVNSNARKLALRKKAKVIRISVKGNRVAISTSGGKPPMP